MIKRVLATVIAILVSVTILLGTFLPDTFLHSARLLFLRWGMVLGAFAFVLAFVHLIRVHMVRVGRRGKGWDMSLLIVVSALGTAALVFWELLTGDTIGFWSQRLLTHFLIPGESALLALTAVTLILAGMRMLRARRNVESVLFIMVAAVVLLISVPYAGFPLRVVTWVQRAIGAVAMAGMRGLIIGVALGTVVTALRAIFVTRPYSDD